MKITGIAGGFSIDLYDMKMNKLEDTRSLLFFLCEKTNILYYFLSFALHVYFHFILR
jgi:hypothetical protein